LRPTYLKAFAPVLCGISLRTQVSQASGEIALDHRGTRDFAPLADCNCPAELKEIYAFAARLATLESSASRHLLLAMNDSSEVLDV
jgi:hypothetical protein